MLDHVENGLTIKEVSIKYHIDSSRVKYFVKLYTTHGKAPFEDRDKRYVYTRELKLKAINDFITGEFSGRQIGINLGQLTIGSICIKKKAKKQSSLLMDEKIMN